MAFYHPDGTQPQGLEILEREFEVPVNHFNSFQELNDFLYSLAGLNEFENVGTNLIGCTERYPRYLWQKYFQPQAVYSPEAGIFDYWRMLIAGEAIWPESPVTIIVNIERKSSCQVHSGCFRDDVDCMMPREFASSVWQVSPNGVADLVDCYVDDRGTAMKKRTLDQMHTAPNYTRQLELYSVARQDVVLSKKGVNPFDFNDDFEERLFKADTAELVEWANQIRIINNCLEVVGSYG